MFFLIFANALVKSSRERSRGVAWENTDALAKRTRKAINGMDDLKLIISSASEENSSFQ